MTSDFSTLIGVKIQIPGHFSAPVSIEGIKPLSEALLLQVRTSEGKPDETVVSYEEIEKLLEQISQQQKEKFQVAGEELRRSKNF